MTDDEHRQSGDLADVARGDNGVTILYQYMLLFYAEPADDLKVDLRDAETPEWRQIIERMRADGVLVGTGRLHHAEAATTLRVRGRETEIFDGPFATTKEDLVGYFLVECANLDEALKHAACLPLARSGSVEIRPLRHLEARERPEP